MNEEQELPCVTPIEDLRSGALKHYEEVATAANYWNMAVPAAINFYYDHQQGMAQEAEDSRLYRIQKEAEYEAENNLKLAEMDKQIAYTEKVQLRELKLQAFKLAKDLKPNYNALGQ